MRRKRFPFTNAELREFTTRWLDHFGHLEELPRIRLSLGLIADRLESIAIMLGGPKR